MKQFLKRFLHILTLGLMAAEQRESLAVGGQAVMEGVMMRNGDHIALAIRKADQSIVAIKMPWVKLFTGDYVKKAWIRGFPTLIETMVNGIKALNISAELAAEGEGETIKPWQLVVTLCVSIALALGLFVVVPHLLTIGLSSVGVSGSVEGVSFQIWDGLLKLAIFVGYLVLISRLPDIRRIFEYHGAEHKTITAYEQGANPLSAAAAACHSRLHPRCGTTFLLFVITISILIHTLLVPLFLLLWRPESALVKHLVVICFKLLLVIPISAIAYEAIRNAARMGDSLLAKMSRAPGLLLQMLTTREPDYLQLEIAAISLKEALGDEANVTIDVPEYTCMDRK